MYATFAAENKLPTDPAKIRKTDVERFITDQLDRWTASTAATRFRYLQQFFRYLVAEDEISESPMARMSPPKLDERPVPVLTEDDLRKLLKAAEGKTFDARRDTAIIRMFISSGIRLGEMAGMTVESVDADAQRALVIGKGDRGRWVPYAAKTAVALDRYMRERRHHPKAALPWLWLSARGRLTDSGISQMLERRAAVAGIDGMHAHRFRHTYAHRWLARGGTEGDLQELAGWKSPQMLARYGASARAERAAEAYQRLDLEGDL